MNQSQLPGAFGAATFALFAALGHAAPLDLQGRLETAPGSAVFQAWYDPNLGITWAANSNINGPDTWYNQVAWVTALTIGGVGGWRLPSANVNGDSTVVDCNPGGVTGCEDNEMGYLYWEEGITSAAPGPFSNVDADADYWTGTDLLIFDGNAYYSSFGNGGFGDNGKIDPTFLAWAVHDGDVAAAVPVPAAVWLFGSGLLGLSGTAVRRRASGG